ncbi:MAG: hypothetical protein ACREUZ_04530, partial [Burkholderiales bacterium]
MRKIGSRVPDFIRKMSGLCGVRGNPGKRQRRFVGLGDRIVDSGTRGADRNERKRAPPLDKVDSSPEQQSESPAMRLVRSHVVVYELPY